MIDWKHIEQTYADCLEELSQWMPVSQWRHQPVGVQPTRHKTKYGMASIKGEVFINQAFIGSEAWQLLNATMRHELAHLCAGLEQGHNARFRSLARQFGADFSAVSQEEVQQIHAMIGHKYELYALLENQQKILLKKVHRKHPKYTRYHPGLFRYLTYRGIKITAFEYVIPSVAD